MNLHHFPYFDPTKNPRKKCYKFQRHSVLAALHKNLGFGASLERRVDEIKNSKSKITSPIICQLSHNFHFFWDTLLKIHTNSQAWFNLKYWFCSNIWKRLEESCKSEQLTMIVNDVSWGDIQFGTLTLRELSYSCV